jgi:hypothetical protein
MSELKIKGLTPILTSNIKPTFLIEDSSKHLSAFQFYYNIKITPGLQASHSPTCPNPNPASLHVLACPAIFILW